MTRSSALFAGSSEEFSGLALSGAIASRLAAEFRRIYGRPSEAEVRSWTNSLSTLARVIEASGIDCGVALELRLPSSSRRIDACLVAHDTDGQPHVVIIELKQWETAAPSMAPDDVVVALQERLHPSVQVSAYADYLKASHSAFTENNYRLSACAYLHNMSAAESESIRGLRYKGSITDAPLFTKGDEEALSDYFLARLSGGKGQDLLPTLIYGCHSPSKKFIDGVAKELNGSPVWTLLDEQRVAFNLVRGYVHQAREANSKAVIVVVGGPGTGKSVIAVHLLVALSKHYRVAHSTASKAFTINLRAIAGRGSDSLFCWNKDFAEPLTEENHLDVLVIDEAHRVRKSSNMRFTARAKRSTLPQTNELMRAARVSVFLLDERQNVRPDEIGNVEAIETAAEEQGLPVIRVDLNAQFRCNGSADYIEWVDRLFSESPEAVGGWASDDYSIEVADTPLALERAVRAEVERGSTGRMVAGFCWTWSDPNPDGSLEPDVQIGSWQRPWNEKSREQRRDNPGASPQPKNHPYTIWATQPKGLSEIGCIYSAQGFEFDCCGVILGNDLIWRPGIGWKANKDASHDPQITRRKHTEESLLALMQHTYRVLMTRGMQRTIVYSTDYETAQFLRSLTKP